MYCIPLLSHKKGSCVICLKDCRTKACACSFFHKECMRKMIDHDKHRCMICNKTFNTCFLEKEPNMDEAESETIRKYEKIKLLKDKQRKERLTAYFTFTAPILLNMYPYVFYSRKIYEEILIDDVCEDDAMMDIFEATCMSHGLSKDEASRSKTILLKINTQYEVYDVSIKKQIHKIFVKSLNQLKKERIERREKLRRERLRRETEDN